MLELALKIATEAHKGQVDKAGIDYIEHPKYVASLLENEDEKIVALLHDVIEDTSITLDDLKSYGFSYEIIEAIKTLNKTKDISYEDYIFNIKNNRLARKVKICDLKHNSQLNRLSNVTEKDIERLNKYKEALKYLEY